MARCRGMSGRQPGVERQQTRLGAGADQGQGEDQGGGEAAVLAVADCVEAVRPLRSGKQAEAEQQRCRAEAGHDEVEIGGAARFRLLVVGEHEHPGGERHELPGEQEAEGVVGQQDEVHAGEERRKEGENASGAGPSTA